MLIIFQGTAKIYWIIITTNMILKISKAYKNRKTLLDKVWIS